MRYFFISLIVTFSFRSIFSLESPFLQSYELQLDGDFSDEGSITSPNGDDYFFYLKNNKLHSLKKSVGSDLFVEYKVDFSYHDFDAILEIESFNISISNDFLFFIAREDGYTTLNYIYFSAENNYEIKCGTILTYSKNEVIDYFNVIYSDSSGVEVIISKKNSIYKNYYIYQNNSFTLESEETFGITGRIKYLYNDIDFYDNKTIINSILIVDRDNTYELWMIGWKDEKYKAEVLKNIALKNYSDLKRALYYKTPIYSIQYEGVTTFIDFDFKTLTYNSIKIKDEIIANYYYVNGTLLYGWHIKDMFYSSSNITEQIKILSIERCDDILDLLSSGTYSLINDNTKCKFFGNYIIVSKEDKSNLYRDDLGQFELLQDNIDINNLTENKYNIFEDFLKIEDGVYYFVIDLDSFISSDIPPIRYNHLILYKNLDKFYLGEMELSL